MWLVGGFVCGGIVREEEIVPRGLAFFFGCVVVAKCVVFCGGHAVRTCVCGASCVCVCVMRWDMAA